MQRISAIELFAVLSKCGFSSQSLAESDAIFLNLTTCFCWEIMANFDINVFIIARKNSCKIGRAPYGLRLIFNNAGRALYDIVRCPAGHRPMFSYTDAGRRPYDLWPSKRKFFKILRCPGDYQILRWCAHRWNRTMSVLFVTIALDILRCPVKFMCYFKFHGGRTALCRIIEGKMTSDVKGKLSDSFTNYNYVGNTKVSVSIKKN